MSEVSKTNETPANGNALLSDSATSAVKNDIKQLRETLNLIEWCIENTSKSDLTSVQLFVKEVIPSAQDLVKHFR